MDSLNQLEPLLRTFWYIALPVSLIFLIQTFMTFIGSDAHDGLSADFNSDLSTEQDSPFQLFSLRNLINFLLGFSWSGISLYDSIGNKSLLIGLSFLIGLAFLFVFFLIIRQIQKLAEDNSFKIVNTIDKTAEVYLNIPSGKSGRGKVLVSVKGSVHELYAVTEQEEIKSGQNVRIKGIESSDTVIVENIK